MTSISIDPGWNPQAITESIAPPGDPWHDTVAAVPRHMFTPRWWEPADGRWTLRDGPALAAATPGAWSAALDDDHPIVTKVGGLRAEDTDPGNHPGGPPAIASPAPGDTLALFEYADVRPGCTVLLADAGTGYECALLGRQLGDAAVTALADDRTAFRVQPLLRELGLSPAITARPTGACDRLISAVPGPAVPADCFAALRPGGRLAALLDGGIVTAEKVPDGTARGHLCLWDLEDDTPPVPFSYGDPSVAPVTVQPDGTLALRLDTRQYPAHLGYPADGAWLASARS